MCSLWVTFSIYIHESWPFGKPYGIKMRCYMQRFGGQLGNNGKPHGNTLGTWWEQEKKMNYSSSSSFPQKKKLDLSWVHARPLIGCMELLFRKLIFGHIWPSLMAWNSPKKEKRKNSLPPPLKRKKIGPLVNACWASHWLHCNFSFQNCLPPFLAWTNSPS